MSWRIEYSDEFELWWNDLTEKEQDKIDQAVLMLEHLGPSLPFPYSSGISGSSISHLRELRVQISGEPYRIIYAFDPRRVAIMLLGGNKASNKRWYETAILKAEKIYKKHLLELKLKKKNNG